MTISLADDFKIDITDFDLLHFFDLGFSIYIICQAIETVWSFVRTTNDGLSVRVLARAVTP